MCINTFKNKLGRALAGFLCIVLLAGGMIQTVYIIYISEEFKTQRTVRFLPEEFISTERFRIVN